MGDARGALFVAVPTVKHEGGAPKLGEDDIHTHLGSEVDDVGDVLVTGRALGADTAVTCGSLFGKGY